MDFSIDFSPIGQLGQRFDQARQQAVRNQILQSAPADGNPQSLAALGAKLMQAGDAEGGLALARFGQQAYLNSPEGITATETARAKVAEQFAPKTANIKLPGGEEVTATKGPNGFELPKVAGLPAPDPNTPQPPPGVDPKKWREARATQLGNIDDKAVKAADDAVQAGGQAVQALNKALTLSKTALAGPLAEKAGYGFSVLPDWLPGDGRFKKAGIDTQELSNLVTNQALENLRSIFGGNPTEGERKILLDVQGSVNQAPEVRERIWKNAIDAANSRIEYNKRLGEQIRSGTYLLPEAQRNAQQTRQQQPAALTQQQIADAKANPQQTLADARAAIEKGHPPAVVAERLKAAGIDPRWLGPFAQE